MPFTSTVVWLCHTETVCCGSTRVSPSSTSSSLGYSWSNSLSSLESSSKIWYTMYIHTLVVANYTWAKVVSLLLRMCTNVIYMRRIKHNLCAYSRAIIVHACTESGYQALYPSPEEPGYKADTHYFVEIFSLYKYICVYLSLPFNEWGTVHAVSTCIWLLYFT